MINLSCVRGFCELKSWSKTIRRYCVAPSAVKFDNYRDVKRTFKITAPEYFNFATDVVDRWAFKEGPVKKTPAFWWKDDHGNEIKWSFKQISDYSKRYANILIGPCGLTKGDRVLVILPRVPQWWLVNLACMRTGTVIIPGTTLLTVNDIRHRLLKSGAKCVVTDSNNADKVDEAVKVCPDVSSKLVCRREGSSTRKDWIDMSEAYDSVSPDFQTLHTRSSDPMTIFFTSGTTGDPKMTEHTFASYGLAAQITGKFWLDLMPNDVHWNLSDTGWAKSAWSNLFAPWFQGSCVFVHNPSSARFDVESTLKVLSENNITTFCTAPTAYRLLVQDNLRKYNFNSLRHCVSAGEPLNPEVISSWKDGTSHLIREGYGQTETVLQAGSFRCIPNKPGSMGKAAPGMDLTVINEECTELVGQEGDLAIKVRPDRPVGLFSRYVDEPERTANAFRGDYYLTGDRGIKDEDDYLWFVGRSDDVIISSGYRIGPFEVESALIEHPAVAESAVVSSPDPERGSVVKAFVCVTPKYSEKIGPDLILELQDHVKRSTAPYKYPRKVEFVESLPKTVSGKIRRVELRNSEWNGTQ